METESVTKWFQQETLILSEISQSPKDKYHVLCLICGNQHTKHTQQKHINSTRENNGKMKNNGCIWHVSIPT